MKLPIAEIFESIQGEGQWVGTPMLFIRLAGCNVGKPAKALKVKEPFPILHTGREAMACCTYDGRMFPCDTDYSLKERVSIDEVMDRLKVIRYKHVCVTGGEPFLYSALLEELFYETARRDVTMHVETSGTLKPKHAFTGGVSLPYWITCSPKLNALSDVIVRADELKLLVDKDFDIYKLTPQMLHHPNVFVCPVNGVEIDGGNNPGNVKRCRELVQEFPRWRISIQTHKLFGWR